MTDPCRAGQSGIRVLGSSGRVRSRRIWNQHHYHVTNVDEDDAIPTAAATNWTTVGLNNFRQNVRLEGEFDAPDLHVTACGAEGLTVHARVRNLGRTATPAGIAIAFYDGEPRAGGELLATMHTTNALGPAESTELTLPLPDASLALTSGSTQAWIVADTEQTLLECRTDNNVSHADVSCQQAG